VTRYAYLNPGDFNATLGQIDNIASECFGEAYFDTRCGRPVIAVRFTFEERVTGLEAMTMMGYFHIAMKTFSR
jgi:hypothetical protein